MCLEDLRLGKGRQAKPPIQVLATGAGIIAPDARRVSIIFSLIGFAYFDSSIPAVVLDYAQIVAGPNFTSGAAINMIPGVSPVHLRVEDFGNLVTGAFSFGLQNQTGLAQLAITEIISNVDAPAVFTGVP